MRDRFARSGMPSTGHSVFVSQRNAKWRRGPRNKANTWALAVAHGAWGSRGANRWNTADAVRRLLGRCDATTAEDRSASSFIGTSECGFVRLTASRRIGADKLCFWKSWHRTPLNRPLPAFRLASFQRLRRSDGSQTAFCAFRRGAGPRRPRSIHPCPRAKRKLSTPVRSCCTFGPVGRFLLGQSLGGLHVEAIGRACLLRSFGRRRGALRLRRQQRAAAGPAELLSEHGAARRHGGRRSRGLDDLRLPR